jgi:hypothetical protein
VSNLLHIPTGPLHNWLFYVGPTKRCKQRVKVEQLESDPNPWTLYLCLEMASYKR